MHSLSRRARKPKWQRYRLPRWAIPAILIIALAISVAIAVSYERAQHTSPTSPPPSVAPTPTLPEPSTPVDVATALKNLEALDAVGYETTPKYNRDLFGQRWADIDRNGCDTRNDMLARDLVDVIYKEGTRKCKVLSGTLTDPYNGAIIDFVSGQNTSVLVQIDHVVPLAWAWHHGAHAWTDDKRLLFANDPINLRATSEAMNQSKKASGPGSWLPPAVGLQCQYALEWVEILSTYDLSINKADRDATRNVLHNCK